MLAIVSNFFFALTMILSRIIGRTDSAGTMTLYTLLTFIVVNGAFAPFHWTVPGDGESVDLRRHRRDRRGRALCWKMAMSFTGRRAVTGRAV